MRMIGRLHGVIARQPRSVLREIGPDAGGVLLRRRAQPHRVFLQIVLLLARL